MRMTFAAAALSTAFLFTPAHAADDCAASLGKIDEAMKTATLDDASKAKVSELTVKAKAENDKGDATACAATTKEAMTLLGM